MKRKLSNRFEIWKTLMNPAIVRFGIFIMVLTIAACTNRETAHENDAYTCPMHPSVTADQPGKCPVCGMDLVRKSKPGQEVEMNRELLNLTRSTNEVVIAGIKTINPEYKSLPVSIQAQGIVTYDTRKTYTIAARVSGRLEKVNLRYTFQPVNRGQVIAGIYSPELITAQRELLFLIENDSENNSLITSAKAKLALLGMSERQIRELVAKKKTSTTVSVYSPYSGYVVTGGQEPPTSSPPTVQPPSTPGGMSDGNSSTPSPAGPGAGTAALIREGDYVTAGQTLFTVVSDQALRIELDLPETYNGIVTQGSEVELHLADEISQKGTVDFIQPFFTQGGNFLKVRLYVNRTKGLRVGRMVNATIELGSAENLWIPREAVVDLGTQKIVYLKSRDLLKPKRVSTGLSAEGMIEITDGLASSDEVAANAQFLVDSESFVNPLE